VFKGKTIHLVILLAALLVLVISSAVTFRWDLLFTGRNGYLESPSLAVQVYGGRSPRAIALGLAADWCGSPAICQLEQVRVFRVSPNRAIIVLQKKYLRGDSVAANQVRMELLRTGENWAVAWAGERWRCNPFRGDRSGWTVVICP
jgi:hypothetical protein